MATPVLLLHVWGTWDRRAAGRLPGKSICAWLQAVSRRWVERAGQFVTDELIHLADGVSMQSTTQSAARLQLPTHTAFHERAEALAPLLQVFFLCISLTANQLRKFSEGSTTAW